MNREFIFIQPQSPAEAFAVFQEEMSRQKRTVYWGGGTELLSMARTGKIDPQVGIDLKSIPETMSVDFSVKTWRIGAGLSLSAIQDAMPSVLLSEILEGIADHTIRNRLTLGGNLCGRLPYREAMLPFLACDSSAVTYGPRGERRQPLRQLAPKGRLQLEPGEFLLALEVDPSRWDGEFFRIRRTGAGPIAYPLISLLLKPEENHWILAHSGALPVPAWAEVPIPDTGGFTPWARDILAAWAARIRSDAAAGGDYRRALFENALISGAAQLTGEAKK